MTKIPKDLEIWKPDLSDLRMDCKISDKPLSPWWGLNIELEATGFSIPS